MKKKLIVAAVCLLIAVGLSSCKAFEDCPAYNSIETETLE